MKPAPKPDDFWSRRKAAVAAEARAEVAAEEAMAAAERDAALEERPDAEILAELDLPDPDTLGEGDDFSVFLAQAVPTRIRTRALRRLWCTNPVLANVDGLVDYGGDFTDAACVLDKLQTAYQVGKGMTKHVEELARQAEALAAEDDPAEDNPEMDEPEEIEEEAPLILVAAEPTPEPIAYVETDEPPAIPRRMRFAFEDTATTDQREAP